LPPPLTSRLPLLLRAGLGLLIDVAPLSRFPLLPLIGFTALGFAVGQALQQKPPSGRRALVLGLMALLLVPLFQALTTATLTLQGGRLSRAHPAVLWNFADGSCRALAVLLLSLAVAPYLAEDRLWLRVLVRLGRGSLLAYAFHIPLCYGRLAAPLAGRLSLPLASLALCGLCGLTYAVVYARDRLSRPYS
jgi:uncharacterized membrane protein